MKCPKARLAPTAAGWCIDLGKVPKSMALTLVNLVNDSIERAHQLNARIDEFERQEKRDGKKQT